jgi:hypothetical protein
MSLPAPEVPHKSKFLEDGDLLPQNLLWDFHGEGRISVIDWESARIGDPAYDLAIVTRGARQPHKESGGLERLLDRYNEAAGTHLPASVFGKCYGVAAALGCSTGSSRHDGPEHFAGAHVRVFGRLWRELFNATSRRWNRGWNALSSWSYG